MMAEMLAALLALSIALGAAGAVIQLSAVTGSAQMSASRVLISARNVDAVVEEAVRLHTPATTPLSRTIVSEDLAFACGDTGTDLCRLIIRSGPEGQRLRLTVNGQLAREAELGAGPVRLVAGLTVERDQATGRLTQGVTVIAARTAGVPLASVVLPDEVTSGCRYDPGSYACSPGGS